MSATHLSDCAHWIDAGGGSRAHGGDHGEWLEILRKIARNELAQRLDVHGEGIVGRNALHVFLANAQRDRTFLDGTVRLVRDINAHRFQIRAPDDAKLPRIARLLFARRGERVHA